MMEKELEDIAKKHLAVDSLEAKGRDALDFVEVSKWQLKAALMAVYLLGRKMGGRNA